MRVQRADNTLVFRLLFLPLEIHRGHDPYLHTGEDEGIKRLSDLSELTHIGNRGQDTNFLSHSLVCCLY